VYSAKHHNACFYLLAAIRHQNDRTKADYKPPRRKPTDARLARLARRAALRLPLFTEEELTGK